MSASNRVAIVTGASRGLGAVIARVLAERGLRPGHRRTERGAAGAGCGQSPRTASRVVPVAGDITDASGRQRSSTRRASSAALTCSSTTRRNSAPSGR